ncbi:putative glycosyltransferase [Halobacteriovorax marinus SJ]|uniref:Glycosyltransferase n=1 Tax=Halobacteriovorax marinus (strain ATCC BAA-682 / DSM 15412 / SJ) TaxID=862908 RepID=E1X3V4_HALMS|nr:glycosyltransferase [Halobacteriovorax marinus]CBW25294.1 putative glycosyltransferase [Halobacteriovorax marinus SJ]
MRINKNILYISARSDTGGGPKHLYDLVTHIETSHVYIAAPLEEPYGKLFIKNSKGFLKLPHRKFQVNTFFKLLIFCKENNINTIHSHGRGAGIYSRLLSPFGFDVIHTFHGVHRPKNLKERIIIFIESILKFFTKKFISVSDSEMKNAINLNLANERDLVVIPNGINTSKFKNIPLGPSNTIGTISRLDPHKNNLELVQFMEELPHLKLLIAGDGEEWEYLNSIAPKNVEFLGKIEDIPKFLERISIFVSASKGEGLPYSLLEAISSNRKVLVSNVTGHKDLLTQDYLYELGNKSSFLNKINNARSAQFQNKYEIKNCILETVKVYNE